MRTPSFLLPGIITLLSASGCQFGEASFDGDIGNRTFAPKGTTFHYIDAHDDDLRERAGRPPLVVSMSWIIFDPAGDLSDLPGREIEDLRHEIFLRDALTLVFRDQGDVTPGAHFKAILEGATLTDEGDTTMYPVLHLSPERLDASSSYDAYEPVGSRRIVEVTLDEADFTAKVPVVGGDIRIQFALGAKDPAVVKTGTITGHFSAPQVEERVAESNLGLLNVYDIMGVPLTPKEVGQ